MSQETSLPLDLQVELHRLLLSETVIDDLSGFTPKECHALMGWLEYFANHKKYSHVGYLQGRFFDSQGNPSTARLELNACHQAYLNDHPTRDEAYLKRQCTTMLILNHHHVGCATHGFVPRRAQFMSVQGDPVVIA